MSWHHQDVRRFVLVVLALAMARSAHAQVSDADLEAHIDAKRAFDACMETRLAAMRDAMALPDEGARNAAIREIPICVQPEQLELPPVATGPLAPPSLATPPETVERIRVPRRVPYREYIVFANLGSVAAMGAGFAVDRRLGYAGAALFALASPAVHYSIGDKDSVAPSLLLHGIGAGIAIYVAATYPSHECDTESDPICLGAALDETADGLTVMLAGAAGTIIVTAIDARFLAKNNVYVTPYASGQGTAGVSLGGTF